jgi:hypothetical protein
LSWGSSVGWSVLQEEEEEENARCSFSSYRHAVDHKNPTEAKDCPVAEWHR